jgi:hypothetical protein
VVTFFGMLRSDDTLVPPSGTTETGVPIFERRFGLGFQLVIEGKPGPSGAAVGRFAGVSLPSFADLQVQVDRALGNGSVAVCDLAGGPNPGGVPAVDPPSFASTPSTVAAVNDLSCRFLDGGGAPFGRDAPEACVEFESGLFGFVDPETTLQFCGFVNGAFDFPAGDTLVTTRLRDETGNVGEPAQIVVRVQP